jgi:hypothetical protein
MARRRGQLPVLKQVIKTFNSLKMPVSHLHQFFVVSLAVRSTKKVFSSVQWLSKSVSPSIFIEGEAELSGYISPTYSTRIATNE